MRRLFAPALSRAAKLKLLRGVPILSGVPEHALLQVRLRVRVWVRVRVRAMARVRVRVRVIGLGLTTLTLPADHWPLTQPSP